jgi:hypothetical protein
MFEENLQKSDRIALRTRVSMRPPPLLLRAPPLPTLLSPRAIMTPFDNTRFDGLVAHKDEPLTWAENDGALAWPRLPLKTFMSRNMTDFGFNAVFQP